MIVLLLQWYSCESVRMDFSLAPSRKTEVRISSSSALAIVRYFSTVTASYSVPVQNVFVVIVANFHPYYNRIS